MKTVIIAKGNTFPHKSTLKANGFRWYGVEKVWVCLPDQDDPSAYDRILAGLATLPDVTAGTADLDRYRAVFDRRPRREHRKPSVVDARSPVARVEPRTGFETALAEVSEPARADADRVTTLRAKISTIKALLAEVEAEVMTLAG